MVSKLIAAIKKEALILLRDRIGLSILFIMPMVLIFVMTLIQDSAFQENGCYQIEKSPKFFQDCLIKENSL